MSERSLVGEGGPPKTNNRLRPGWVDSLRVAVVPGHMVAVILGS